MLLTIKIGRQDVAAVSNNYSQNFRFSFSYQMTLMSMEPLLPLTSFLFLYHIKQS